MSLRLFFAEMYRKMACKISCTLIWVLCSLFFLMGTPNLRADAPDPGARVLALTAPQQAALGIQTTRVQAARTDVVLASAQVTTRPGGEVTVSAPYAGQIARLQVGVGDRVARGAGLADFTSPQLGEARRQWDDARLQAQIAQAALQRDQAMLSEGIIPAVRVQQTQARHDAAQAALHARAAELQSASLRFDANGQTGYATGLLLSPIAGVVAETYGQVGQRVEAGTVLFRVVDDKDLQLEFQLAPDKASRVRAGDVIDVAQRGARARVTGVTPFVQAGQMARGRAVVTERGQLHMGETLTVSIQAANAYAEPSAAWRVPARALSPWQGQSVLFVGADKGFRAVAVKVLSSNDDVSIVASSQLSERDWVAVTGVASLRALLQKDE
jgi:cobalt-zinc-cadmium efflux system membrane fusion protein